MLKILLVSNGFYPEISPRSFRATELAKEFARQGYQVVVYSKYRNFDYSEFLNKHEITFKMWDKDRFPTVPNWKGKIGNILSRGLTRILSLLFEYPGIEDMFKVKNLLKNENGYNLMISFAVPFPVHWGVAWARTKKHPIANIWVADCGDPYMGVINDTFKKPFYFSYLEKSFLRKSDFTTIPKIELKARFNENYHQKIIEIPQGLNFDKVNFTQSVFVHNSIVSFAFAGIFMKNVRDPKELLDYLTTLKQDFRFYVFTSTPSFLEPYLKILEGKLVVSSFILRQDLITFLSKMDFLINIGYDPAVQVPSKLIDYALSGRPILNIKSQFIAEDFDAFLSGDYKKKHIIEDFEKYNIKNVTNQFLNLLNE